MNPLSDFAARLVTLNNGHAGLRGGIHIQVREPGKDAVPSVPNRPVLDFIASDESLDRYNEVISATGWKLDNYRRNPVFQNAHQTGDIMHTLGRAISTEVRTLSSASPVLLQRIEFACDVNPMARIAYGLYKGGFLNAVSVGFIPLRWKDGSEGSAGRAATSVQESSLSAGGPRSAERSEDLGNPYSGGVGDSLGRGEVESFSASASSSASLNPRRIFLEQELLEVSAVAIPANPNALALGVKSGAIEKSDMKEVVELFRSLGADDAQRARSKQQLLQLAREFHRLLKS